MGSFDRIDHQRLLDILREKIQDDRFIISIRKFLTAGYLENCEYHKTYSGTPQGSVISPILTNLYLDQLDRKLEAICQQCTRGSPREANVKYAHLLGLRKQLARAGRDQPWAKKNRAGKAYPRNQSQHPATHRCTNIDDPSYIRVKFLRYADDVIIGVIGPNPWQNRSEKKCQYFWQEDLKLELNQQKTIITHPATERAQFLGYLFQDSRTPMAKTKPATQRFTP